ncbi:MAG: hypothetical protein A2V21_301075 [Deltaproteobacteria bacterium GWC2_55_46]|nr:MAG: hypothetical protein A2Z79_10130 [Deltaproteobacteria bacterium GWA2_55_82]OGQ63006.1 MAG: hypothetical protein A3I81_06840 [Deltaproteobacteria bacterium RIFCSPLOWO2_02_FULL_55_12]OIJ72970.1 MAG: hypothetical protein A2V21_301075 [Deltaproteobacteria bacterium GWC2_55_46]
MTFHILSVTYIITFLGLWAVSLVEAIGPVFPAFSGALAILSLFYNLKTRKNLPAGAWNVAAMIVFFLFIADFLAVSRELIVSGTRFLTILLVMKLFDLKVTRDYLIVFGLAFFQVLAAASSSTSPVFFLILSLYVVFSIWAMIVFNMKKDIQEAQGKESAVTGVFGLPFFLSVVALSAACLLMTIVIFFTIPRMGVGIFERKTANTLRVSGFSEKMDLGAIGPVKLDSTVVMRVETPAGKPSAQLYFRGATLDIYDGAGWTRHEGTKPGLKTGAGVFHISAPGKYTVEQKILLEPLDIEVIFAASSAFKLTGRFHNLWVDPAGTMRLPSPPFSRIEYRAWSDVSGIRDEGEPDGHYLDASYLDTNPEAARIRTLAASIIKHGATDLEKARAIEDHLRSNYRYTLSPAYRQGRGPLEDFLFYAKEGYCEHYSTAMVMMLRSIGVPARIVTGFLEGEWNELGGYFIVRQQDAHSWVEAYVTGLGWMRFDPTPPSTLAYRPSVVTLYMDLLRLRWNRYIIQYSFSDQMRIAWSVEKNTASLLDFLKGAADARNKTGLNGALPVLVAGAAFIGLCVLALRLMRRKENRSRTPAFYREMLEILAKRGIVKREEETALEFAARINDPDVTAITETYHLERYGNVKTDGDTLVMVKESLEKVRTVRGLR